MSGPETIPEYLTRMRTKDREKHGFDGGWKSTSEVAEFYGIPMSTARGRLHRLRAADVLDAAHFDNSLLWRIKL